MRRWVMWGLLLFSALCVTAGLGLMLGCLVEWIVMHTT